MLKDALTWIIPIYGDMKIHQDFSRSRIKSREEIQNIDIDSIEKRLNERENEFKQELTNLIKKYDMREEWISPERYIAKERDNISTLKFQSAIIPEMTIYLTKYIALTSVIYQFSQ